MPEQLWIIRAGASSNIVLNSSISQISFGRYFRFMVAADGWSWGNLWPMRVRLSRACLEGSSGVYFQRWFPTSVRRCRAGSARGPERDLFVHGADQDEQGSRCAGLAGGGYRAHRYGGRARPVRSSNPRSDASVRTLEGASGCGRTVDRGGGSHVRGPAARRATPCGRRDRKLRPRLRPDFRAGHRCDAVVRRAKGPSCAVCNGRPWGAA